MKLRSILCLCPEDFRSQSQEWADAHNITLLCCAVGDNMEPFVTMNRAAVAKALAFLRGMSSFLCNFSMLMSEAIAHSIDSIISARTDGIAC
jgi:hypothetical protein